MSQAGIIDVASSSPTVPVDFVTDSGTAIAAANVINVLGGTNIDTAGAGNTITIATNSNVLFDSVGIGGALSSSAVLSVISTTKGFLPPVMTTVQRDAIVSPATGLTIYNSTAGDMQVYNGAIWVGAAGSGVTDITGTANQIIASSSTGSVTLSTPQDIATSSTVQFGSMGIGASVVASSILSLSSTTLGFLPPAMTTAQRNAIGTPATGLTIYNTSNSDLETYNGSTWIGASGSGVTSIAGTADRITASASTGAVTLDIAATYIGQESITTLGTVGTGTWNGSVIAGQYGGTGVANTGLTITLSSGGTGKVLASDVSGNATWQSLSGLSVTSITGTANQITASASTGDVTLSLPNGISIGSYQATSPPTGGMIIPGVVSIGDSSTGAAKLNITDSANDTTNYGQTLQITRAAAGAGQYIAFVRTLSFAFSLGFLPGSNIFGFGSANATDASFSPMNLAFDLDNGTTGLATVAPQNRLDVAGAVAIGSYAGVNTAPSNGLIVSGNSGFGTAAPDSGSVVTVNSSQLINIYCSGTQSSLSGNAVGAFIANIFSFSAGNALDHLGISSSPTFLTSSGTLSGINACISTSPQVTGNAGTITNVYGVFCQGGSASAGTITNSYGGYFTLPSFGTNRHALHADNASIGSYTGSSVPPSNGLIVSGNTGIGTAGPQNKLDVSGAVAIGSYAGVNTAPSNGMIVSGDVGIGTTSTGYAKLFVYGTGAHQIEAGGIQVSGDASGNIAGVYSAPTITPTVTPVGISSSIFAIAVFDTTSANFTDAAMLYVHQGLKAGAGTISNLYAGYFSTPTAGATSNVSLYAGNAAIGYTGITPPSGGMIVSGQTAIGTSSANVSALLTLSSTTLGFLPPVMTTAQRNLIGTPATGLTIYNTSNLDLETYNGSSWVGASGSGVTSITGTANQVIASASTGAVTLSTPQDIGTSSTVQFGKLGLGVAASNNQLSINGKASIGYSDTAAPSNGLIVSGNSGFGTSGPDAGSVVTVGASQLISIACLGTQSSTSGNGIGLYVSQSYSFSAGNALDHIAISSTPTFLTSSGTLSGIHACISTSPQVTGNAGTISNVYGIYCQGGSASAGTITNSYGGYFTLPSFGTNKHALHADTASVGSYTGSSAPPSNGLIVSGNTGIGTAGPQNKLDVSGAAAFGSYAGVNTAPSNGLIVSGTTLVGATTATWGEKLGVVPTTSNQTGLFIGGTAQGSALVWGIKQAMTLQATDAFATVVGHQIELAVGNGGGSVLTRKGIYVTAGTFSLTPTYSYGGYFEHPAGGTNRAAIYTESLSLNYPSVNVTQGNAVISGSVSIKSSTQTEYALYLAGGIRYSYVGTATDFTVTADVTFVGVTNTGAVRTITLPAVMPLSGYTVIIKDESGNANINNIVITPNGNNIDGSPTDISISVAFGSVMLYSNGAQWLTYS